MGSSNFGTPRVEPGQYRDYLALAPWHYIAGPPATVDVVLRARLEGIDGLAGVLVVSYPLFAGWWRERAWPGRYAAGLARCALAARLNAEVRTISRVIVDPRFRALGVASALVRSYLARPRTPRTEAAAAMGALCPFFARAGMTEHTAGPDAHARSLRRRLRELGVTPMDLVRADRAERLLARRVPGGRLGDLLRAWCRRHPTAQRAADLPPSAVIAAVAARLGPARGPARTAYTAEHGGES